MSKPFSIKDRIRSFKYAFIGMKFLIRDEHNFRIHLVAAVLVIFLGFYFEISQHDWLWIIICIGLVLVAEAFNTAIEKLVDLKEPTHNLKAGKIKDLAAAAVLLTALMALVIGMVIFWPYIKSVL